MPRHRNRDKNKNKGFDKKKQYHIAEEILTVALEKHKVEIEDPVRVYRRYLQGFQWSDKLVSNRFNDETVDNMVYTTISALLPSINLNRTRITVKARKYTININGKETSSFDAAIRHQLLTQFLFDELEIKETLDMVLVYALLGSRGVVM